MYVRDVAINVLGHVSDSDAAAYGEPAPASDLAGYGVPVGKMRRDALKD